MDLFENLDPDAVDEAYEFIVELLQEKHPDLDARRGALSELVCKLHAILLASNRSEIEKLRRSLSLSELLTHPEDADDAAVDALASNYGIRRRPASCAYGPVAVFLDKPYSISINEGSSFRTEDGREFLADKKVLLTKDDLDKTANGEWYFMLDVHAATPGRFGQLLEDAALTPSFRIPGFVRCSAAIPFEGGHEAADNEDMAIAITQTFAAPGYGSKEGLEHLILHSRDADGHFTGMRPMRIVGAGEPEMERDDGFGGKVDIYVAESHKVQDLQEFLDDPNRRPLGIDIKVVLAEPCWVDMEIDIDTEGYQSEAAAAATKYVNSMPVGAMLRRSKVVKAINQELPEEVTVSHVRMTAKLQMTDWQSGPAEIIDPLKITAMTMNKVDCRCR